MLVDIKVKRADPLIEFLRGEDNAKHPRVGVYISHLNFNHEIQNKKNEYPVFDQHEVDWMNRLYSDESRGPLNNYERDRLDHLTRVPADVETLYIRDNWEKITDDTDRVLNSYGVCDSWEQLLELYSFELDPRKFVISLTRIDRDPDGEGGGWRWHKWGPYVGYQKRSGCEYLDDEPDIDHIYVYHIYEILD